MNKATFVLFAFSLNYILNTRRQNDLLEIAELPVGQVDSACSATAFSISRLKPGRIIEASGLPQ
jgi:hypothetical protein